MSTAQTYVHTQMPRTEWVLQRTRSHLATDPNASTAQTVENYQAPKVGIECLVRVVLCDEVLIETLFRPLYLGTFLVRLFVFGKYLTLENFGFFCKMEKRVSQSKELKKEFYW